MTLNKIFTYPRIKPFKGFTTPAPIAGNELLGIEIEGEGVKYGEIPNSFRTTNDGSLRNNGVEFVSVPIEMQYLEVELGLLSAGIGKIEFTERCSLHVHLNVRDLEEEELYKLILLYGIYERLLFRISGKRQDSTYATPLYSFRHKVKEFIRRPYVDWQKYSALNLLPIWGRREEGTQKLGTIEFRHHEGTINTKKILDWCNIIISLKKHCRSITLKELEASLLEMNTSSSYYMLTEEIFGVWAPLFLVDIQFKGLIESSISDVKYMAFLGNTLEPYKYSQPETNNAVNDEGLITGTTAGTIIVHDIEVVDDYKGDLFMDFTLDVPEDI